MYTNKELIILIIIILSILNCLFIPESIDKEWKQQYSMDGYPLVSFAISTAPNGIDVWLSGGFTSTEVISKINIIRYLNVKVSQFLHTYTSNLHV